MVFIVGLDWSNAMHGTFERPLFVPLCSTLPSTMDPPETDEFPFNLVLLELALEIGLVGLEVSFDLICG